MVRTQAVRTARRLYRSFGGLAVERRRKRDALRIVTYHRFHHPGAADILAGHCAHLRRFYNVLSLDEMCDVIRRARPARANSVTITVDDGYADFYTVAEPVFRAYGIPVTLFATTSFIDGHTWIWVDVLRHILKHTAEEQVEVSVTPGEVLTFSLGSPEQRSRAVDVIKEKLKKVPDSRLRSFLQEFATALRVRIPETIPAEYAPATWDQLRELAGRGVTIGAHTNTHPILSQVSGRNALCSEIAGSKARIESELQRPVQHFCYPNGTPDDFTPEIVALVRDAGYRSAVTAEFDFTSPGSDLYTLRRVAVDSTYRQVAFEHYMVGMRVDTGI